MADGINYDELATAMNGTMPQTPVAAASTGAGNGKPKTVPPENRAAAYMHLLGLGRFDQKEPVARANAFEQGYQNFRQKHGLKDNQDLNDAVRIMQNEVAKDPEAIKRMQELSTANGGKPGVYEMNVIQIGLRATGAPLAVTGEMNTPTMNALSRLSAGAPAANAAASAPDVRQASRAAVLRDPQVAEAQAYMRVLGFNGNEGKQNTGPIDGIKGPLTTAALEQFSKENKLPKDASMNDIITALKGKALAGPGLARMEDIMGKSVTAGGVNQDIKAVQVALKANGMNVPTTGQPDGNTPAAINVMKSRLPTGAPAAADTAASRGAELAAMQAQMRTAKEAAADVSAAADNTRPPQPATKTEEIVMKPSSLPTQEIHVAPGGETEGVTPRADGGVVTVVVGEANAKTVQSASPDPSAGELEKTNMRAQLEAQQAQIRALQQEQAAMKATGVRPPETDRPVVGRGPHLSSANGAYTANASQRWSTPPGSAYSQAAAVAREIESGNSAAAGIRVDSFRMGSRDVVYAQTPDGMAYKFNSTRDGSLMTAGAYNMNNPRESKIFEQEMKMAGRQETGSDNQMRAMEHRERAMRERDVRSGSIDVERGLGQMGDRNSNNDISGGINVALGALKIFRPGGGLGF